MNSSAEIAALHVKLSADVSTVRANLLAVRSDLREAAAAIRKDSSDIAADLRRISTVTKSEFSGTGNAAKALGNELRGTVGNFKAAGGDAEIFAAKLRRIRSEALEAATGLDATSTEYAQLQGVAARATTALDQQAVALERNARAAERAAQEARDLQIAQSRPAATAPLNRRPAAQDDSLSGLITGQLGGVVAAYGVREVVQFGTEMVRTGDQIRRTETAVSAFSDNAQRDIQAVVRGTSGMATKFEAAQVASLLLRNGIATNTGELSKFSKIASVLGSQTGLTPAEYIGQLAMATQNLSYERLDQLAVSGTNVRRSIERLKEEGYSLQDAFRMAVIEDATATVERLEQAGYDGASGLNILSTAGRNFYDGVAVGVSEGVDGITRSTIDLWNALNLPGLDFQQIGRAVGDGIGDVSGITRSTQAMEAWLVAAEEVKQAQSEQQRFEAIGGDAQAFYDKATLQVQDALNAIPFTDQAARAKVVGAAFFDIAREAGYSTREILVMADAMGILYSDLDVTASKTVSATFALNGLTSAYNQTEIQSRLSGDAQIDAKNAIAGAAAASSMATYEVFKLGDGLSFATERGNALAPVLSVLSGVSLAFADSLSIGFAGLMNFTAGIGQLVGAAGQIRQFNAIQSQLDPKFGLQNATRAYGIAQRDYQLAVREGNTLGILTDRTALAQAELDLRNAKTRLNSSVTFPTIATPKLTTPRAASTALTPEQRDAQRYAQQWETVWTGAVGRVRSAVDAAFDTSTTVTEMDGLLTAANMYTPKFNEAGRRLGSVMAEGAKNEWADDYLGDISQLTNDQVRAQAAQLQKDINDWLRPDLFNFDAALENARRSLIGNANRERAGEEMTRALLGEGFAETEIRNVLASQMGIASMGIGEVAGDDLVTSMLASIRAREGEFTQIGDLIKEAIATGGSETGEMLIDVIVKRATDRLVDYYAEVIA